VRHVQKRPVQPDGRWASVTDERTWSSFAAVRAAEVGDGVGFVLNGDGIVCVDLDHCVEDGRPTVWAERVLSLFPDAPVEVSLSGTGLHVWGVGDVPSRIVTFDGGKVEVYSDGRFIAMTGRWLRRGPLVDVSAGVRQVLDV
jgi:primase-polymerase (primpol)-like protein